MMKKLIFIILTFIIACEAYCQTKYTLPYDTVIVTKPNGTGYLKAAKGIFADSLWHRITLSLSDSSKLAATTEWVKRQNYGSGGGGGTPGGNNRNVQFNNAGVFGGTDSIKWANSSLIIKTADSVGDVLRYSWNTNPLTTWTDNTSTATLTTDGVTTTISGAGLGYNLSNYISLSRFVGVEDYTITDTIKITQKDGASKGLAFVIPPSTGMGNGLSAQLLLADTAGYWAYNAQDVVPDWTNTSKSASALVWSVNDRFAIKIQKIQRTFIFTAINLSNGSTTSLQINNVFPQVGQPRIYFYGPTQLTSQFAIRYDAIKRAKLAIMGDSISWGGDASDILQKYFSIVEGQAGVYGVTNSGPGEFSAQGVSRIADLQAELPNILLYAYGVNDFGNAVSITTFSNNVQSVVQAAQAQGTVVAILNLVPQTSGSVVTFNDTLQAIATRYSCPYINIYSLLKGAGTAMNSKYDFGDGVHPNSLGHAVIAQAILTSLQSYLTTPNFPLIFQPPQTNTTRYNTLVLDDSNRVWQRPNFPDPQYIQAQPSFDAQHIQSAIMNISGGAAVGSLIAAGSGNFGSPDFDVNVTFPGVTHVNKFVGGNLQINTAATGTYFSGGDVWFASGAQIRTATQGLRILFNGTTSANEGLILQSNSVTTGPWFPFIYKAVGGTFLAGIDSIGQIYGHAGDGTGYASDSVAVWKDGKIQAATVGGGGSSLFPTTGTGTATGDVTGDISSHTLNINGTTGTFQAAMDDGTKLAALIASGGVAEMSGKLDDNSSGADFDLVYNLGAIVTLHGTSTFTGGAADSSNYVGTSYVQKDYVLNHIANAGGGGGANTALSNLASVAINTALLPGTDASIALGSGSKRWNNLFLSNGAAVDWGNGATKIAFTSGLSLAVNIENGLMQLYKSGQSSNIQLYNTTITDGLSLTTTPVNLIRSIAGTSNVWVGATGESVVIGNTGVNPGSGAALDITSTTKGFLPSRMTTTQKNAISSPAEGLVIYDTTLHKLCVFTGTVWETVTSL